LIGEPLLIRELLANLIDNALRYTPAGGSVTVRCRQANGAVLEVEDNGIGIPESQREKVLERFHRVEGSPGGGCGLGLAIVQEIARIHGATLEITAPPAGRGTLVCISFPQSNTFSNT
jgi:two-component system sensor histidine kinase TctE